MKHSPPSRKISLVWQFMLTSQADEARSENYYDAHSTGSIFDFLSLLLPEGNIFLFYIYFPMRIDGFRGLTENIFIKSIECPLSSAHKIA